MKSHSYVESQRASHREIRVDVAASDDVTWRCLFFFFVTLEEMERKMMNRTAAHRGLENTRKRRLREHASEFPRRSIKDLLMESGQEDREKAA
jgi:hypothetical protein